MKKILISLFIVFISCEKIYANNNLIAGNTAFQNKDYILTIKYYKKEIKKNNTNAQVYSQYCGAESYLYDTNKSINLKNTLSICNKAIELNPSSAETYFYKGRIYKQLKKDKEAIEEYTKAIAINPKYEQAYLNRGIAKSSLDLKKEAISDYSKAIELNNTEDILIAYYKRGHAYLKLGDKKNAEADFKKVANSDIKINNARDYAMRGNAKIQTNDFTGSIFDYKKAIELDNNKINYYLGLATAQGLIKDYDSAIETCTKGIKKFDKDIEILYSMRGFAEGSKELFIEMSNKTKRHDFTKSTSDFKKAQEIALKNNNQKAYEANIKLQNTLQHLAIMIKSNSPNISISLSGNDINKTVKTLNGHTTISYSTTKTIDSSDFISKEGNLNGVFSNNIRIDKNKTLIIKGSLSGDIQVEVGATLINYGNISGDINNNGRVVNYGNMSGDINNNGTLEIYGINTGDIYTNKNIYIDKNAITNGTINRF